ncbi:MAG: hypothetical protein IJ741_10600 [Schwartzia sp.]|nr:hypothetical protein [Schwartzia sp. (in: firmicutes)]
MDDLEMERRLSGFDFSALSPVREPLLQRLLSLRRSQEAMTREDENPWAKRMDDEALDEVAAAGNPLARKKPKDEI